MKQTALGLVIFLVGCGSLLTEQRMARLETEVHAIQRDFGVLSQTFTPAQQEKYAQAKTAQDEATFHAFLASLDGSQRTTMETLLTRSQQATQEQQALRRVLQQDHAMRRVSRHRVDGLTASTVVGVP